MTDEISNEKDEASKLLGKALLAKENEREPLLAEASDLLRQNMEHQAIKCRDLILPFRPQTLLGFVWSSLLRDLHVSPTEGSDIIDPITYYQFALEYLHAIWACFNTPEDSVGELSEEKGNEILKALDELHTISSHYCMASSHISSSNHFGKHTDSIEFQAKTTWMAIRGNRYQVLEEEFFRFILGPHNDALLKVYKMSASDIAAELQKATHSTRTGFSSSLDTYDEFLQRAQALVEERGISHEEAGEEVVRGKPEYEHSIITAIEGMFEAGFCNLSKHTDFTKTLLEDLSFERGANKEFFAEGPFKGTPMRTLPARLKPLIRFDEETYAVDGQFLRDSCYRAIQRGVLKRYPEYREDWNKNQKNRVETAFAEILQKQFSTASIFNEVFYKNPDTGEWAEADTVVVIEDVLMVIEAKAGVMAMHSPATNFDTHVRTIKKLVIDARNQTERFLRYLSDTPNASIYRRKDGKHHEMAKINLSKMRMVLPIGLTVENFSPFSTMCKELPELSPILDSYPFISMSIDDLLVLSRLLPTAGEFFHYMSVRQRIAGMQNVWLFDEMDHLGAYIEINLVDQRIEEEVADKDFVWMDQFSNPIDNYFSSEEWETQPPPRQSYPEMLSKVLDVIEESKSNMRLLCSSAIRDFGETGRENINSALENLFERAKRVPVMGVFGGEDAKPIQFWVMLYLPPELETEIERKAAIACLACKVRSITTILILIDKENNIKRVDLRKYPAPTFAHRDFENMSREAERLLAKGFDIKFANKNGRNKNK